MPRSPRHVVFVLPDLNSGGAERAVLNLAAATPRSRCTVVAETVGGDLMDDPLAAHVVFASSHRESGGRLGRIGQLIRTLGRLRPDVVVAALSPIVPTAAARALGRPIMQWVQSPWSRTTAAGGTGPVAAIHRAGLLAAGRASARVMAVSPGLIDECVRLGIEPAKLALLPNGLSLPATVPQLTRSSREAARIVTIGRLGPPKRHDLLLEAIACLGRRRRVELFVLGSGPDDSRLRRLAADLGVSDRVQFTGFVEDPTAYLRGADLFALATDYEGFANVIVQALACEVPIVVSDVPYGPRFIAGGTPLVSFAPPGSASALAEAIDTAVEAGEPPPEARAAARRRAEAFTVERVAARFDELVDDVLARRVVERSLTAWP